MISGGVSRRAAQIPSGERLRHYFRELADKTPIDIILYNIPQFSNEISLDVVKRLAADCFVAVNFPEGFREGVNLREFHTGRRTQPMSPHEMGHFNAIREKLECLLSECGFDEEDRSSESLMPELRATVEAIVRKVVASRA